MEVTLFQLDGFQCLREDKQKKIKSRQFDDYMAYLINLFVYDLNRNMK